MPRISVIIPTYNSAATVVQSLMSVIEQTRSPDEIIISDNHSTDSTVKLIEQVIYKNTDIPITLTYCSSQGAGPNRNHAVSKSQFEVLAFLDADDRWDKNFLETMTENPITDNLIRGSYARYINPFGHIYGASIRSKNDLSAKSRMLKRGVMPFLLSTWIIKRKTFCELNGFDSEFVTSQDAEFLYRFLSSGGNLEVVRQQLITYLIHEASKTTNMHFKQKLTLKYILIRKKSNYINLQEYLDINSTNWNSIFQSKSDILIRRFITSNKSQRYNGIYLLFFAFLFSPIRFLSKIWLQRPSKGAKIFSFKSVIK